MSETDSTLPPGQPTGAAGNIPEFSVSDVSQALKRLVEGAFPMVRIRGEVSGFRGAHASGHAYFSLKDEGARIEAVCFRGVFMRVRSKLQEGLEVIATGRITTYPGKSNYQIVIESIEPAGAGALLALLEERRRKLAAEGLFDEARKKALPYLPSVIGVVTSPTGAVIRDILHRLSDRFPRRVLVWPVAVQGEKSAAEVAAAIRGFNALVPDGPIPRPDVLIVARGGGSVEDLWSFNEEVVVRAVCASTIPVISAVGHETDTTLIDFAADRRAPTPTAAAEMAVPVRADLVRRVLGLGSQLANGLARTTDVARQRLALLARGIPRHDRLLELPRQRLDLAAGRLAGGLMLLVQRQRSRLDTAAARLTPGRLRQGAAYQHERLEGFARRMELATRNIVARAAQRLDAKATHLAVLDHRATLARGFALVARPGRGLVTRAADLRAGDRLVLSFADGDAGALATEGAAPPSPPGRARSGPQGQGDLF